MSTINLNNEYTGIVVNENKDSIEVKVYKENSYLLTIHSSHRDVIISYFQKYSSLNNMTYSNDSNINLYIQDNKYKLSIDNLVLNNVNLNIELIYNLNIKDVVLHSVEHSIINLKSKGSIHSSRLYFSSGILCINSSLVFINNSNIYFKFNNSLSQSLNLNIGSKNKQEHNISGIFKINNVLELEIRYIRNIFNILSDIDINNGRIFINSSFLNTIDKFTIPPNLLNDKIKRYFTSDTATLFQELDIQKKYEDYNIITYYGKQEIGYTKDNMSHYRYSYVIIYMDMFYNLECKFIIGDNIYSIQDLEDNYELKNQFDIKILKWITFVTKLKSKLRLE